MLEEILQEINQLEMPIAPQQQDELMEGMNQVRLLLDTRGYWSPRAELYSHSKEDLEAARGFHASSRQISESLMEQFWLAQACFVRDLQDYLSILTEKEDNDGKIRKIFEAVLKVGTSRHWAEDSELVLRLLRVYRRLENEYVLPQIPAEYVKAK